MAGRPSSALLAASSPAALAKASAPGAEVSSGTFSGAPFDLNRFRAIFPDRWSGLLRAHFRNAREVGYFFDVDEKTARNWWSGITGPSGAATLIAVARIPGALPALWRDAA